MTDKCLKTSDILYFSTLIHETPLYVLMIKVSLGIHAESVLLPISSSYSPLADTRKASALYALIFRNSLLRILRLNSYLTLFHMIRWVKKK